jgi:tungstate transport system ATP-binding protein
MEELLGLGRLEDLADRPARVLSGGEKQRVAMVRALASQPAILLLDEPTASLDPQATAMIEELITDAAARDIKVLIVTHEQGQARRLADDVVFMHAGSVVEHCAAERFFDRPASEEARAYLAGRLLLS